MPTAHTLVQSFTISGTGLHTGKACTVTVRPCNQGGRVFVVDGVTIPAVTESVTDTRRCTTLARDGVQVRTVEHLLAACWLAHLDHVEIEVDGPELPALGGSAHDWFSAILSAGVRPLEEETPEYRITDLQWYEEGDSLFCLMPAQETSLYAAVSLCGTATERMMAGGAVTDEGICAQILRARTFAFEHEVRALLDANLAQGGSLDNAVIVTTQGYLNEHVWPQEPAWHKVLDLAGDLALTGVWLRGQIIAVRGGHHSHVALARHLRAAWLAQHDVQLTACQRSIE